MLRKITLFILFLLPIFSSTNQGIIIACNDYYMKYLVPSLKFLREEIKCTLPIEIWHAGDELSIKNQEHLLCFSNTVIKDLSNYFPEEEVLDSRGWQIKAYILKTTNFEEVVLMDADAFLLQDPSILLNDENYIKTGAFFFRDRLTNIGSTFSNPDKPFNFLVRKNNDQTMIWLKDEINTPSEYIIPIVTDMINGRLSLNYFSIQESGLVILNKRKHSETVDEIFRLNKDHKNTYNYIHGDKETFWIACEKLNKPYFFNPRIAVSIKSNYKNKILNFFKQNSFRLGHFYNDSLFFIQKKPHNIFDSTIVTYTIRDFAPISQINHTLNQEDCNKLVKINQYYETYTPKLKDKLIGYIK